MNFFTQTHYLYCGFPFRRAMVVCAWGAEGAAAGQNDVVVTQSASPPDKVVDTLGAGDTFNAAFIYSQVKKWDLKKGLEFACRVAGHKVGQKGFRGLGLFTKTLTGLFDSQVEER